jgi:predicted XRE-type DNA-binding protein
MGSVRIAKFARVKTKRLKSAWDVLTDRGRFNPLRTTESGYNAGMNKPLSDQIRDLIRASGMTGYELHQASGLSQSRIGDFLRGKSLTSCNLDRLLAAIPQNLKKSLRP